ncbi:MAG: pyridoxamine 5'-phosphate oxidase family protein [Dehalococcoidia bacterium]
MPGSMTRDEITAFLSAPIIARLATVQSGGAPYIAPVWQQWDGERMYIVGRAGSEFVDHIRNKPRVAISIADDVNPEHARVLIEGDAVILEGPAPMTGRMLQIAEEMSLRYMGANGPTYIGRTVDRPRCLIAVTPESIVSWTGGEWHSRYSRGG